VSIKITYKVVLLFVIVATALNSGCIIPFPHIKQTCGSIEGIIVDQETRSPIVNAHVKVLYPDGGTKEAKTDEDGMFYFSSKHRFHWAFVFGVALNYSLPYDLRWCDFQIIMIEADGYFPVCFFPDRGIWSKQIEDKSELPQQYHRIQVESRIEGESNPMGSDTNWSYPEIPLTPLAGNYNTSNIPP
jgi:hypothetical protein